MWFFFDWSTIEANLRRLNLFEKIEKAEPAPDVENKETNPPSANPLPDYHHQYPHCPYHGPCPSPYRWMPRD